MPPVKPTQTGSKALAWLVSDGVPLPANPDWEAHGEHGRSKIVCKLAEPRAEEHATRAWSIYLKIKRVPRRLA